MPQTRSWLRHYRARDFRHDASAAIVLTALLVPAGIGYAQLAGLPPATGLQATVAALVAYALCGPSRTLIMGPDSSLAPVIAAAVIPLAHNDQGRAVALAGLLAVLAGLALVAGGALHLGLIMDLFSKPIRLGYLHGLALIVVISQLPKLLGFDGDRSGLLGGVRDAASGISGGDVHGPSAAIGLGALGLILLLRRAVPKLPALLLAVAAATALVWALAPSGVTTIGALPRAFPAPALGGLEWHDVLALAGPALGIALLAFTDTGLLSRSIAATDRESPAPNREMSAVGLTNVAAGLLGGFPVSGSATRTPVARASGARTQATGLIAAALVTVVALAGSGLARYLPVSALAAVVIAAALSLTDVPAVVRLSVKRRDEMALAVAAFAGVALFGVLRGIVAAVALSLFAFVVRAWRPHAAELGRVDFRKGYHDLTRNPQGRRVPGLVLARFDAPLFFANAGLFAHFVRSLIDSASEPVSRIVIAAEPITDIDTTAADELVALDDELAGRGVRLVFAELTGPVRDRLKDYGLGPRFEGRWYPTLGTAVAAHVAESGADWVDWTQRRKQPS